MSRKQTVIERFARFSHGLRFEDIPSRVAEKIRLQILTSLSAARFSSWHEEAKKIYLAEKDADKAKKPSSVLALNRKLSPEAAAVTNTAYAMSLDFDDYMLMGHMGHSSVLTSLAFLEESGGTVGQWIASAAAGNEIMGRLSLACFLGPLNGQMWSYIHCLGAAAAVARARGLSEAAMANALALSLYQPPFCLVPGFWKEGAKLLTASLPVRTGVRAARYAEKGLEGPMDIVEGPLGFFHFFAFHPVEEFMRGLGTQWLSETLSYKRYPGTSYIGASVDSALSALLRLGKSRVASADEIRSARVSTTFLSYSLESVSRGVNRKELDSIAINFSVRYSVAYALLRGDLAPEHFRPEELARFEREILLLAKKVEVVHDWGMTLATLGTFPMIGRLVLSLSRSERRRIRELVKAVNRAAGPAGRSLREALSRFRPGLLRDLARTLSRVGRPVSLSEVGLADYPMLQSAATRIELPDGRAAESECSIPSGGAGRSLSERSRWVARRYEKAFGRDSRQAMEILADPKRPVSDLVRAALGPAKRLSLRKPVA